MKKAILLCTMALLVLVSLIGCQPAAGPTDVAPTAAEVSPTAVPTAVPPTDAPTVAPEPTEAAIVLTLVGKDQTIDLTLEDLKAMPSVEGQAGTKSSTGEITPPTLYKGVLLTDLIDQIGGLSEDMGVEIEAEDGYAMTYSGDQIKNGEFIAYDPATGDEVTPEGPLQVIVAYEQDGQPLDPKSDGTIKLAVISEKNDQVIDGHWAVKWVRKISLRPMAADWSLALDGIIQAQIDRGSFESCSASGCHTAEWTDTKTQVWTGTPLWLVVGEMDDEIKHDGIAFNRELAATGYSIELVAKDGYSVTLDSSRFAQNNDLILANEMNDNPLTEGDFPLKLVGPDLTGKESIGAIEKIILHPPVGVPTLAPTTAVTPTEAVKSTDEASAGPATLPEGAAIMVTGAVENPQSWTLDELKALDVVQETVEHPKKGSIDIEGVRLKHLLKEAAANADATKVEFTASDGFTAEMDLAAALDCPTCLVTFTDTGALNLSMPDMDSGLWVKDVTIITVK